VCGIVGHLVGHRERQAPGAAFDIPLNCCGRFGTAASHAGVEVAVRGALRHLGIWFSLELDSFAPHLSRMGLFGDLPAPTKRPAEEVPDALPRSKEQRLDASGTRAQVWFGLAALHKHPKRKPRSRPVVDCDVAGPGPISTIKRQPRRLCRRRCRCASQLDQGPLPPICKTCLKTKTRRWISQQQRQK
jgi:hypothetical protein